MADAGREDYPSEDVYSYDPDESNENAERSESERFDAEDIDNGANDLSKAFEKFKGQHYVDSGANFNDYLMRRRLRCYAGNAYNLEILGLACSDEPETIEQKHTRLLHEIQDLKEQVSSMGASQQTDAKSENQALVRPEEVDALLDQLKGIQVEQIQGKPTNLNMTNPNQALLASLTSSVKTLKEKQSSKDGKPSDGSGIKYEILAPLSGAESVDAARCAKLEARLAGVEKMIGSQEKFKSIDGENLSEMVQLFNSRLQMLDSAYLDGLDARLLNVTTKLNETIAKAEKAENAEPNTDPEFAKKVDSLTDALDKYDKVAQSLPDICDRMLSLQALHEQAMQVSQAVTQIDGVNQQLSNQIELNNKQLQAVKETMTQNIESVMATLKTFEDRIAKLK